MSTDLNTSTVKVREDEEGVRWITFNRPEAANAITLADLNHIGELFRPTAKQPKAVVFTGAGDRCYSAGMHLTTVAGLDTERAREFMNIVQTVLTSIRRAPYPIVSAVNGHCIAGGLAFAMISDIRIVAEHTLFGVTEVKAGVPSVGDIAFLQQYVGLGMAKEMILTGDNYPAKDLPGLCNRLVPADQVIPETKKMLSRLTCHTSTVMGAQKRLFELWQNTGMAQNVEMSIEFFTSCFGSEETAIQAKKHRERV